MTRVDRSLLRRLIVVLAVAWAGLVLPSYPAALAAPSPSPAVPRDDGRTVAECLAAGEVWLVVRTDTQVMLRSECVGRPETGRAALDTAKVAVTTARGGYLCTLAGYPSRCPTTYDGRYWQYFHAAAVGADWQYSQRGADNYAPAAGSIEGWCYNAPGSGRCSPPSLSAEDLASPPVDLTPEASSGPGPTVWVALAVVGSATVVFWVVRRRPQSSS